MKLKELIKAVKQYPEDTNIEIRICGHNNNEPVNIDSVGVVKDCFDNNDEPYIESIVLNCLETQDLEWEQTELLND